MPTITRFLGILLTLAAAGLAAVFALAYLVGPQTRTFVVPVDPSVITSARPLAPPPAATGASAPDAPVDMPPDAPLDGPAP